MRKLWTGLATALLLVSPTLSIAQGKLDTLTSKFTMDAAPPLTPSVRTVKPLNSGGQHVTAYSRDAGVHFSQDVSSTGVITGRHWTNHDPNIPLKRIGDRD